MAVKDWSVGCLGCGKTQLLTVLTYPKIHSLSSPRDWLDLNNFAAFKTSLHFFNYIHKSAGVYCVASALAPGQNPGWCW